MSNKNPEKKKRDDSFVSVNRRKRNRYLKIVGIPIGIAIIILGVIVATQAQEHGLGAKIVYHIHPHLNMTVDGKPVVVPQGIGINSTLYKDHSLDKYSTPELAPLHTHDSTGTIHVESTVNRPYTLGQLLSIWGLNLNNKSVNVTIDGKTISPPDSFKNHVFKDRENITMAIGKA
jgi:hypothetical protein